jgi:hypothetical protein
MAESKAGRAVATGLVIDVVQRCLAFGGIRHIVVATSTGETGTRFLEALAGRDVKLVCVSHHAGFGEGDELDLVPEHAAVLRTADRNSVV